jgi:hypothetical protein
MAESSSSVREFVMDRWELFSGRSAALADAIRRAAALDISLAETAFPSTLRKSTPRGKGATEGRSS